MHLPNGKPFTSRRTNRRTAWNRRGFTLIELLIVIGIIGILASAVLAAINPVAQLGKARDAGRKSSLIQLGKALQLYYQDNGRYPTENGGKIVLNGTTVPWGGNFSPYMTTLPKDSGTNDRQYAYIVTTDGQTFYLFAQLERTNDPQVCSPIPCTASSKGTSGLSKVTCTNSANATDYCNFGVASSNADPNQ